MTLDDAADTAADLEQKATHRPSAALWTFQEQARDLYVRAFRAGYKYRETEQLEETKASWRALTGSDSPQDPRTASKD